MTTWPMYIACLILKSAASIVTTLNTIYLSEHCGNNIRLNNVGEGAFFLKLASSPPSTATPSCEVTLRVEDGHRMMFTFLSLDLSDCDNSVSLYGNTTHHHDVIASGMCSPSARGTFVTPSNTGIVKFSSTTWDESDDFNIMVTDFRITSGNCTSTELHCANQRCIDSSLWCNGYNNCGDGSDCGLAGGRLREEFERDTDFWAYFQYFFLGVGVFGVVGCLCVCKYLVRKQKRMTQQSTGIPSHHKLAGPHRIGISQNTSTVPPSPGPPAVGYYPPSPHASGIQGHPPPPPLASGVQGHPPPPPPLASGVQGHPPPPPLASGVRGYPPPPFENEVQNYSPSFTKIGQLPPPPSYNDVQPYSLTEKRSFTNSF